MGPRVPSPELLSTPPPMASLETPDVALVALAPPGAVAEVVFADSSDVSTFSFEGEDFSESQW